MSPATPPLDAVRELIADVLSLPGGPASLQPGTALFGSLPEFDSMSVVHLIGALEQRFGFTIEDGEISADLFATPRSVAEFVARKLASTP